MILGSDFYEVRHQSSPNPQVHCLQSQSKFASLSFMNLRFL